MKSRTLVIVLAVTVLALAIAISAYAFSTGLPGLGKSGQQIGQTTGTTPTTTDPAGYYSNGQYAVLAWNDLGMHCYNPSFADLGVLPPYNTLWAQVFRISEEPRIITSGITVTYTLIDNTYSAGKTDFWDYSQQLFNVTLQHNVGLTGKTLSGQMDPAGDHFVAEGIPLTEYRDQDLQGVNSSSWTRYPYQLAYIVVKDLATGTELAHTTVCAPVSTEMTCNNCHTDDGDATLKYPIAPTGKVDRNILALHDYLHPENSPKLIDSTPVLCASCHSSNALAAQGKTGVPSLSNAMHTNHANLPEITPDTNGCYNCHPGPETQCLRDVMSQRGMTCINCHGTIAQVAQNTNPWRNEPRCDNPACHGNTVQQTDALYRFSTAMGGVYCEGCHDSPHAIAPSREPNDAIKFIGMQGVNGQLRNCDVCHSGQPEEAFNHNIGNEGSEQEDSMPINALLLYTLPFAVTIPIAAFIILAKKRKIHYDLSVKAIKRKD